VPTKAALSLPSSAGQGRENTTKGLWIEVWIGKDYSPITIMGKPDSTWEKLILFITNQYQSKTMRK